MTPSYREIKLSQNQKTIIDTEDYERLSKFRWHALKKQRVRDVAYCVVRTSPTINGKKRNIYMHRVIMNCPKGMEVDHINHNALDNRKSNLRVCSHAENTCNRKNYTKNPFKGVYWQSQRKKWQATIDFKRKRYSGGLFYDIIDAAKAYNKLALKHHGKFACINVIPKIRATMDKGNQ